METIRYQLKDYEYPNKGINNDYRVDLISNEIMYNSNFFNALFQSNYKDYNCKVYVAMNEDEIPIYMIKSIYPSLFKSEIEVDNTFNVEMIESELIYSWLNKEEKNFLKTANNQGFIIKSFFKRASNIYRYEERIFLEDYITFEEINI